MKRSPLKRTRFTRKVKSGVRITHDGRVIYAGRAYTAYRLAVWESQNRCCADCRREIAFINFELHHPGKGILGGRGLGGSHRNDLEAVGLCGGPFGCHAKRHRT